MDSRADNILEVRDLAVHFPVKKGVFSRIVGYVKAVDGVSFDLRRGDTLGVVGESGSGKTTVARVIAGLQKATAGSVACRGRVAMVFQDPLGSLNPRQTVRTALEEVIGVCGSYEFTAAKLLDRVGMGKESLDKYPHEFSGGQRQRICIARAIALRPEVLICDEAVSALDLSVRATILDLLNELKRQLSLSVLFITHDLGVVQHVADRIIVMRSGKIMEEGTSDEVLKSPHTEYARQLVSAVPKIGVPLT